MNVMRLLGLAAVCGLLILAAPAERAQALREKQFEKAQKTGKHRNSPEKRKQGLGTAVGEETIQKTAQ